jgi:hypothetical protein
MIELVENDLRRPSGEFLAMLLPAPIQIFYLNILIPGRPSNAIQREASFFCLIGSILFQQNRIIVNFQIF